MDTGRMYPCHIIPKSPESLCEMKNLQVLNTKPYIINITAINALGSATKTMVFDLEAHGESMIELPSCFFFTIMPNNANPILDLWIFVEAVSWWAVMIGNWNL